MVETIVPPFFPCPVCHKEKPLEVLDLNSAEANTLCMLCEREGICRECSRTVIHPEGTAWRKEGE